MNVADSQRLASILEKLGYLRASQESEADLIILNTCVVRQSAEDKAYGYLYSLRPLKERRPQVILNVMGCLVGVKGNPRLREIFPYVDVFSPPSDPRPLLDYLDHHDGKNLSLEETEYRNVILDDEYRLPKDDQHRSITAYIPIIYGCSHACSFCVIPYRRGPERSRHADEIEREIRQLADQGIREVTLLGQIVDRYGMDRGDGIMLPDLLRRINDIPDIKRIRFLTSHPNWMGEALLQTVAELPKVCEHIEVPLQAGDDEILKWMKRGYTASEYCHLIDRIRRNIPEVMVATDIIVGFPGEDEKKFQQTYNLLEALRLDVAHLARYSVRPGTLAARRMRDDVSQEEKMRRFRALEALQESIAAEINAYYLGREVEVLVEGRQKGRWKGRTRTNKLVFFESQEDYLGKLAQVKIEWAGPWSMRGIADPTSDPKEPVSHHPAFRNIG
jgi:tRNA-2-methylthio-N6-dimethylallyladenosine synthase